MYVFYRKGRAVALLQGLLHCSAAPMNGTGLLFPRCSLCIGWVVVAETFRIFGSGSIMPVCDPSETERRRCSIINVSVILQQQKHQ